MSIFQDIKTAVKVTSAIRKAREAGADAVQIKPVYTVPCVTFGPAYANTIEWGQTWKVSYEADRAVMEVFKGLPYEVQRRLEFSPKNPGEWAARARFWQQQLKPVLPPKMYHAVMAQFTHWYAYCIRRRLEAAV